MPLPLWTWQHPLHRRFQHLQIPPLELVKRSQRRLMSLDDPAPRRASEKNPLRRPRTHRPCLETQRPGCGVAVRHRGRWSRARGRAGLQPAAGNTLLVPFESLPGRGWPSCSRASSGAPAASFQPLPTADCGAPKPVACRSDTIARRASLHCEVHHTVGSWHPGSLAAPVRHHLRPEQVAAFPVGSGEATEERT